MEIIKNSVEYNYIFKPNLLMKNVFLIVLLCLVTVLYSQNIKSVKLEWQMPVKEKGMVFLVFEGASYNSMFLPLFTQKIAVSADHYEVGIKNVRVVSLTAKEEEIVRNEDWASEFEIENQVFEEQFQKYLSISILPIRRNPLNHQLEKILSFDLEYRQNDKLRAQENQFETRNESLLAQGDWLKLGVVESGVYKITFDALKAKGLSNIQNVHVYGFGGKTLPENNNQTMGDDMSELAIKIEKGQDGIFNSGDFVLFYAEGPLTWAYDENHRQFRHQKHQYSDTIFYFLNSDSRPAKSITAQNQDYTTGTIVNCYKDRLVHEVDANNILRSGKVWYGEHFDKLNESYELNFNIKNLVYDSLVGIHSFVAARSNNISYINVFNGNKNIQSIKIPNVSNMDSEHGKYVTDVISFDKFHVENETVSLALKYDQYADREAWINYLCLNPIRKFKLGHAMLLFTNVYNLSGINKYQMSNVSGDYLVWNLTNFKDVKSINASFENNNMSFVDEANSIKSYAVFRPVDAKSVKSLRKIKNQNLHALKNLDYIILTHSLFKTEAEDLAVFHRQTSGLKTKVVTNEDVYNEFSSGIPDITSIKNFMRHLYHNRSFTDTLKYLLLFGDGSYDNRPNIQGNTNFILTYQTDNSISITQTLVCDDYFGYLDESEGLLNGLLDLGIGRLPVKSKGEAQAAIKKIKSYKNQDSFGSWRSRIAFSADNDNNTFFSDAENLSRKIETQFPFFNHEKIYLDAYPLEESAGRDISPEATKAFNRTINKGVLLMNYIGHGGSLGLAEEQLISIQDIQSWNNENCLSTFFTATCEFTRFDDYSRRSAGEYTFLNSNGGAIALFTTVRIAYSLVNKNLYEAFYDHLYDDDTFRFGDIMRRTKNNSANPDNLILIGDPALSMAVPKQKVLTQSINGLKTTQLDTITISALSKVTVQGFVCDDNEQKLSQFNGIVYPTVFDKADTVFTLGQFGSGGSAPFKSRNNIVYKGRASVKNGEFSFSFIVPKDISYKNGLGRISYYADNKTTDALGLYENIAVGGMADSLIVDHKGPEIELYMNDENFIFGGTTDENPILIAHLFDENGLNTIGNGIGHDLVSKLDGDDGITTILNSSYESDLDSYQSGKVKFPYEKLEEGQHQITFKAWDVFNNLSKQYLEFYVAKSSELALKNIFNYPNPFTTNTDFYFDHNQSNQLLEVIIQIYTVSGKLIKTIESEFVSDGFRSLPINWDGKDDFNDPIGKGVYIYKLKVKADDGKVATEFQKLVILK